MRKLLLWLLLCFAAGAGAQPGWLFGGDKLSSSNITCLCQDQVGYIWIGTEFGLNRFDGYRFTSYLNNPNDSSSLGFNVVVSLFCDREGRLWVGNSRGLQRYDYATDGFETCHFPDGLAPRTPAIVQQRNGRLLFGTAGYGVYTLPADGGCQLVRLPELQDDDGDRFFNALYEAPDGTVWKSGNNRFGYIRPGQRPQLFQSDYGVATDFFDLGGTTVAVCRDGLLACRDGQMEPSGIDIAGAGDKPDFRTAMKDRVGNVYISTRGNGLFWIPAGSTCLQRHPATASGFELDESKIVNMLEDRQGNIWAGCQHKGLLMIPNRKAQFDSWSFSDQKVDIGSYVSSVCEGDDCITWCTVQNKGVYGFDAGGRIVAHPQAPNGVEAICRDRSGGYWLCTTYGVYAYDPLTGKAQLLTDFACDKFYTMFDDGRGHLYLSAFGKGLLVYDRQTRDFRLFTMTQNQDTPQGTLCNDWVMTIVPDHEGRIWMGTSSGVACYDPVADSFKPFGWQSLGDKLVNTLCETREGDMLIGTEQGLYLWRRATNQLEQPADAEPLRTLDVSCIVQDNSGNTWCSTSMGIWHYHTSERKWVGFVRGAGLLTREYVNGAGLHRADDRIFFATGDGLTTFTPQQVHGVRPTPGQLHLTGFYIGGRAVSTLTESNGTQVTSRPVAESSHFTVSYLDNSFSLEFSLLDYANAPNIVFEHRLNSHGEWMANETGQNSINLNHLASGTYRLEVRATDNGVPSEVQAYTIVVTAPWYRTTLAYIIYIMAALLVGGLALWAWRRRMRQRLDEDKMKFLINATHDIRSPLTLVMGPLEKLQKRLLDSESKQDLEAIDRNAHRILSLVNQILDVRKIDKQQMHLHCRETDMQQFVKDICQVYEYNAKERNIAFNVQTPADSPQAWIDRKQFDKVVSNLLSNAFKYSYDYGTIDVRLSQGHDDRAKGALKDYVEISVSDTGTGMRDDTIQHLFDRFYQGKGNKSAHIEGTGIGLNLCKMIVDMHHGTIAGRNRDDGQKGSIFTVRIPQGSGHLAETELDREEERPASLKLTGSKQPSSQRHLLVVDDDEEMARYIARELSDYYYFTACGNGKDALRELLASTGEESRPYDLVISDVMMPEMDGFTMLRLIRTNVNISHLPVIMLTSKSDIGNRLEGLERGADAYLTKPFNIDELHATIDNLIATRLRLRGKYIGAQQPVKGVQQIEVKGNDELLMERIVKSINQHLGDSDLNVDTICHEAGISRAHLHRKMKDLTGIPVSEFIRNIRMEQAARLLKEQKLNITQVAYTVGFSNLAYFSSVFRKHFGVPPRDFIEQQKKG